MRVIHPQTPYNGIAPENVFVAMDDMGAQYGVGSIVYQYQPDMFPDRPHNLFISLESQQAAQYLLFGALMGRAQQLWHEAGPNQPARVYTSVHPADTDRLRFYERNGFDLNVSENAIRLEIPEGPGREPMGCTTHQVPLTTMQEQIDFIGRLQHNGVNYIDQPFLQQMQVQPHFLGLGMVYNTPEGSRLIGEIVLAGQGSSCEVLGMYIIPEFRRQGLGRVLLHRAIAIVAAEGVSLVVAHILSNSMPQCRLAANFRSVVTRQETLFPSVYLNP